MINKIAHVNLLTTEDMTCMAAGATKQSPYEGEEDDPAYIRNPEQSATVYEMLQITRSTRHTGRIWTILWERLRKERKQILSSWETIL